MDKYNIIVKRKCTEWVLNPLTKIYGKEKSYGYPGDAVLAANFVMKSKKSSQESAVCLLWPYKGNILTVK